MFHAINELFLQKRDLEESDKTVLFEYYLFAYGLPLLITGINSAVAIGYFGGSEENVVCDEGKSHYRPYQLSFRLCNHVTSSKSFSENKLATSLYRADSMCWLHGHSLYFGFLLPVGIMLLVDIIVFSLLLAKMIRGNLEVIHC